MLSDVDLQDDPVKVVIPMDLDRMTSWACEKLDIGCWWVEMKDGAACRRCGRRQPQGRARLVRFKR